MMPLFYNIKKHNIVWYNVPYSECDGSFWRLLKKVIKNWLREDCFQQIDAPQALNPIVFVIGTDNNYRALSPIMNRLDPSLYSVIDNRAPNAYYPRKLYVGYALLYILPLLVLYLFSSHRGKRIITKNFLEFFPTMGFLKVTKNLLSSQQVRLFVMANDHSSIYRSILYWAPKYGVDTMYLQHCSVGYHFPSLNFTYSFLDGEESYEKYHTIGNMTGTVYLSGSPRFDVVSTYKRCTVPQYEIGIAVNLMDNEDSVVELCEKLLVDGYTSIIVRPHPRQQLSRMDWFLEHHIAFSDSGKENPFVFLSKVGIVVAGETGLHLDAAIMGVYSLVYSFDGKGLIDWYSFVKNGMVIYCDNYEELKQRIESERPSPNEIRNKSQWYNASCGRSVEGKVGELISEFIIAYNNKQIQEFDHHHGFTVSDRTSLCTKKIYGSLS